MTSKGWPSSCAKTGDVHACLHACACDTRLSCQHLLPLHAQHPMIENPEYEEDAEVYLLAPIKFAGFEIWQVKAGTIFDNILLTDDLAYARKLAEDTWGASKAAEQEMFDAVQAKEDAARKEAADKVGVLLRLHTGVATARRAPFCCQSPCWH